jgi:hypothetical protein
MSETPSDRVGGGQQSNSGAAVADSFQGGPEYSHEQPATTSGASHTVQPAVESGAGAGPVAPVRNTSSEVDVLCGPLLNYRRMSGSDDNLTWYGSVLIVATPGDPHPELTLKCLGRGGIGTGSATNGTHGDNETSLPTGALSHGTQTRTFPGQKLYEDGTKAFWRFTIDVPLQHFEAKWEYGVAPVKAGPLVRVFVVPAATQSMRIMFHSCNGFSVGTDVDAWSGPALWNDVLRMHANQPFHVMIGGGDQIYNDGVRVEGPLKTWTAIANPKKRRDYPFGEALRQECDDYYFNNYIRWYGQEPFKSANCSIAQLNIWDDHDIIDGFGSYTDHFMRCSVFRGIGGVAHKYDNPRILTLF